MPNTKPQSAAESEGGEIERALIAGDLSGLNEMERLSYYTALCKSLELNPLTRPFDYLNLQGRLILYANASCCAQLRAKKKISLKITERALLLDDKVYRVTVEATTPDGQRDEASGVVFIGSVSGENIVSLLMKAETKAKRRVTLSISGLSLPDESEIETIPNAETVTDAAKQIAINNSFDDWNCSQHNAVFLVQACSRLTSLGIKTDTQQIEMFNLTNGKKQRKLLDDVEAEIVIEAFNVWANKVADERSAKESEKEE